MVCTADTSRSCASLMDDMWHACCKWRCFRPAVVIGPRRSMTLVCYVALRVIVPQPQAGVVQGQPTCEISFILFAWAVQDVHLPSMVHMPRQRSDTPLPAEASLEADSSCR